MSKGALKIAKLNLRNVRIAYFVSILSLAAMLVQMFIYMIIYYSTKSPSHNSSLAFNILWLIPLMAGILIPTRNFRKVVNLGGKRDNFLLGSLIAYAVLAAAASLVNTVAYYTVENFIRQSGTFAGEIMDGVMNVVEIFGWTQNGPILVVLQQFAFLFMVACIAHTLSSIQNKWYGWVTDIVIAAILGTFIPIASLRTVLLSFFYATIFHPVAIVQIAVCLVIALAVYMLNKPIFARKTI